MHHDCVKKVAPVNGENEIVQRGTLIRFTAVVQ